MEHDCRQHGGETLHNIFAVEDFGLLLQMSLGVDLAVVADVELFFGQLGLVVDVLFVVFRKLHHCFDGFSISLFALVKWLDFERILPLRIIVID